jgi:Pyruvate/2-oxoacid:ferredoxin oxidoreductase delta subunit
MTGAVKNVFGMIPGFRKANYHKEAPKPKDFANIIVDILSLCPPGLTIMDAILSMEGDGPSSGQPRQTNLILASTDPVAVDAVASEIIGLNAGKVPTIKAACDAGLGIGFVEAIDIVGERLKDVKIGDFALTSNRKLELIPNLLVRLIDPYIWVRPAISDEECTKCNTCVQSCPTEALAGGKGQIPIYDYSKCINCWCCHELCPSKAVFIDKSWLARKFIR